ncbi:hypothetical protein [Nocardioides sp. TF02-7]|uniref:hypothetical protein n=1 Tax=Nocardioides sp. TF02-7 TaxID=2917724 RepID=UPI001F070609|nr:hypothetical protein [Nocardioides sp. TF02-7]UMG91299.1 hypothetical protein MF408_14100 [Nocardioides sp. TF02-7]
MTQLHWRSAAEDATLGTVVGDADGDVKRWFDQHPVGVVVLRPDRIVAGAGLAQDTGQLVRAVARATSIRTPPATPSRLEEERPWRTSRSHR